MRVTITRRGIPVAEIVRKGEESPRKRTFGVLGNKKIVIDRNWARAERYGCLACRRCVMPGRFLLDTHAFRGSFGVAGVSEES